MVPQAPEPKNYEPINEESSLGSEENAEKDSLKDLEHQKSIESKTQILMESPVTPKSNFIQKDQYDKPADLDFKEGFDLEQVQTSQNNKHPSATDIMILQPPSSPIKGGANKAAQNTDREGIPLETL